MNYEMIEKTAVLSLDDGKANAIGFDFMNEIEEKLNRAEEEATALVIAGRPGLLSGGFDLKVVQSGPEAVEAIMTKGTQMMYRLFSYPKPLIIACTGHAIAAGAFLLLTADNRIGAAGKFNIGLNETAIGSTFPVLALELSKARLNPAYITRAVIQSEAFSPEDAVRAGFLDQVEPTESLMETALATAARLSELPEETYAQNKRDIRQAFLQRIRESM